MDATRLTQSVTITNETTEDDRHFQSLPTNSSEKTKSCLLINCYTFSFRSRYETFMDISSTEGNNFLHRMQHCFRSEDPFSVFFQVDNRDTLEKVALRFNSTPSELLQLNKLNSRTLFPGQVNHLFFISVLSTFNLHRYSSYPRNAQQTLLINNYRHRSLLRRDSDSTSRRC